MSIAALTVAIVGTIAALLAAYFAFSQWRTGRQLPDLFMELHGRIQVDSSPEGDKTLRFRLKLRNVGKGPARFWMAKIRSLSDSVADLTTLAETPRPGGFTQYSSSSGRWRVLQWQATEEGEVIPPRQNVVLPLECRVTVRRHEDVIVDYMMEAHRVPRKDGVIVIRLIDELRTEFEVH
jgi:hypothetical protein